MSPGPAPKPPDNFEAVWQTALLTMRRMLRGRRWILAAVLVVLPAAIAAMVAASTESETRHGRAFVSILAFLHFGIAVPGVALSFATAFPWPDADEGSLVWWFTAPVRRLTIHLGRFAAALVFGTVLLPASVLLLTIPLSPGEDAHMQAIATSAVAATLLAYPAYLALFWLASTCTRKAMMLGTVFVVVENILVFAQGNVARLTLIHYVRSVIAPSIPSSGGRTAQMLLKGITPVSVTTSAVTLGAVTVVALGLSLLLVERIEYRGKSSQAN